jgi:hypothetical protein
MLHVCVKQALSTSCAMLLETQKRPIVVKMRVLTNCVIVTEQIIKKQSFKTKNINLLCVKTFFGRN